MSARSVVRRALALVLAGLMLPGCSSWRPAPGSPDPALLPAETEQVRVQLASGSRLVLHRPALVADSLRGTEPKGYLGTKDFAGPPTIVPASNIAKLETRQHDKGKTSLLLAGTFLALTAGIILASAAAMDCIFCTYGSAETPPAQPPLARNR